MNNIISDYPNALYLGLILIFLIINFFSNNREGVFTIIKYLSIWIIIALLALIAYSYRYELQSVKEKVTRELIPGTSTHDRKARKLILTRAQDGHFYLNSIINNQKIRFLIDTGASDVALSLNDARKIGINIKKINFDKIYHTANGKAYGASVILDHLIINNVKFKKVSASIMSSEMGISLLGMTFLNRLKKFEFRANNLILYY
jgi:aspartyl protease family protein